MDNESWDWGGSQPVTNQDSNNEWGGWDTPQPVQSENWGTNNQGNWDNTASQGNWDNTAGQGNWGNTNQGNWDNTNNQGNWDNSNQGNWGTQASNSTYQNTYGNSIDPNTQNIPQQGSLDNDYWANEEARYNAQNPQPQKKEFNFSGKVIGLGLGVVCFVICICIVIFSSISVKPKTTNQGTSSRASSQVTAQSSVLSGSYVITEITDNIKLDYSAQAQSATGMISRMYKVLQNNQVLYCVQIGVPIGGNNVDLTYYCNYGVFSNLNVGDILLVSYMEVSKGYYTITDIAK